MDDREDFRAFVDASARSLQRTAWLLTGDWHAAEDLVQAALVETWRRWPSVDEPAAYVRQVIVRTFLRRPPTVR